EKYARSKNSSIGSWAIQLLATEETQDRKTFFYALACRPSVSVGGQIALDETLTRLDMRWAKSKERDALLNGWSQRTVTDWEWKTMVERLYLARESIGYRKLFYLITIGLEKDRVPSSVERDWYSLFHRVLDDSIRGEGNGPAFDFLMQQLPRAQDETSRCFLAEWLAEGLSLEQEQTMHMRKLTGTTT